LYRRIKKIVKQYRCILVIVMVRGDAGGELVIRK
jgi:hypothetical protein